MAYYLSPLVAVVEVDLTNTIAAVSTSIAVLIMRNPSFGPEFKQNLVTTPDELNDLVGNPTNDAKNYCDYFSGDGYLKYGKNLYVTSVRPEDASFAGIQSKIVENPTPSPSGDTIVYTGELGKAEFDLPDYLVDDGSHFLFIALDGLIQTEGDDYSIDYVNKKLIFVTPPPAGTSIQIRIFSGIDLRDAFENTRNINESAYFIHQGDGVTEEFKIPDSIETSNASMYFVTLDGLLQVPGLNYTIDIEDKKLIFKEAPPLGTYIVARVFSTQQIASVLNVINEEDINNDSPFKDAYIEYSPLPSTGDEAMTLADFQGKDPDRFKDEFEPEGPMDIIAFCRGSWGNNLRVSFISSEDYDDIVRKEEISSKFIEKVIGGIPVYKPIVNKVKETDSPIPADDKKSFLMFVEKLPEGMKDTVENNWDLVQVYNVSTDELAIDDQGRTKYVENVVNNSKLLRISLSALQKNKNWTLTTPDPIRLGGGSDGNPNDSLVSECMEALDLYNNPESIDINIIIDGDKPTTVKKYINELCISRLDCMGILDCKYEQVVNNKGDEVTSLVNWRKGLAPYMEDNLNINSDKVAVYGNWAEVYDKYNKKNRWVPLSGYIAGIFAFTDNIADPWFAPAGLNRGILQSILRLAFTPTLGMRDQMYKNGINPVVTFSGQGHVLWGQKTMLDKESAFNRINVRRLFIILEKSISTAARYFLFEPNDERTRDQLKNMIEPYLRDVKARRGIYDFKVICDESNNTPERIDRNELWCDIMIKPTRAAEFIVLRFSALATGASFEEAFLSVE